MEWVWTGMPLAARRVSQCQALAILEELVRSTVDSSSAGIPNMKLAATFAVFFLIATVILLLVTDYLAFRREQQVFERVSEVAMEIARDIDMHGKRNGRQEALDAHADRLDDRHHRLVGGHRLTELDSVLGDHAVDRGTNRDERPRRLAAAPSRQVGVLHSDRV